jgi:hypothetical protein
VRSARGRLAKRNLPSAFPLGRHAEGGSRSAVLEAITAFERVAGRNTTPQPSSTKPARTG